MVPLLYVLLCLIWGSTWLAIKVGLAGVPPLLGAGLRFLLSAFVVACLLVFRGTRIKLTRDDTICILTLGVLVFWLDYGLIYWAETRISSGLTAVLFSTMPLMTALLSAFWMQSETLTFRKVTGILIGISGTALLFWPDESLGVMTAFAMLSVLTGCLCAAVNLVVIKRYGQYSDGFVLNVCAMALGASCLLITSAAVESWTTVAWTLNNVAAILYLSLFGSVMAFSMYYHLIKRIDATAVSLQTLISPVVALALGRVFLHETVTPAGVIGIVTILLGVGVATLRSRDASRQNLNAELQGTLAHAAGQRDT